MSFGINFFISPFKEVKACVVARVFDLLAALSPLFDSLVFSSNERLTDFWKHQFYPIQL